MSNELKEYFIKNGGQYWLPHGCGYTERVHLAGLFTKKEAFDSECSSSRAVHYSEIKTTVSSLISIRDGVDEIINLLIKDE